MCWAPITWLPYSRVVRAHLLVVCILCSTSSALAAPAADVVVLWVEQPVPQINAAIGDAAARNSAAYIDASRDAATLPYSQLLIKLGIAANGALES